MKVEGAASPSGCPGRLNPPRRGEKDGGCSCPRRGRGGARRKWEDPPASRSRELAAPSRRLRDPIPPCGRWADRSAVKIGARFRCAGKVPGARRRLTKEFAESAGD